MKKKSLFLIFGVFVFSAENLFATGWIAPGEVCTTSNAVDITSINPNSRDFPKNEGKYRLCVKEAVEYNPYAACAIRRCSGNSCGGAYLVTCGASSVWTNTAPVQSAVRMDAAVADYWYDRTAPVCGTTTITDTTNATYTGGWTSKDLYSQTTCSDTLSGCNPVKNVAATGRKSIAHLATKTPDLTFYDHVGLVASLQCRLPYKVLLDQAQPQLSGLTLSGTSLSEATASWDHLAGPLSVGFSVSDTPTSSYGVSGIHSVETTAMYITDHKGVTLSPVRQVFRDVKTFPIYNSSGSINRPDNKNLTIDIPASGGFEKIGKYKLSIVVTDFAGNTDTRNILLQVYPNNQVQLNITSRGLGSTTPPQCYYREIQSCSVFPRRCTTRSVLDRCDGTLVYANHNDRYTYTFTLLDSYGNPVYGKNLFSLRVPNEFDIPLDITQSDSLSAIDIMYQTGSKKTDSDGKISFSIQSYAPGVTKQSFHSLLKRWDRHYQDSASSYTPFTTGTLSPIVFSAPFRGSVSLYDDVMTSQSQLVLGQYQKIRVIFERNDAALTLLPSRINMLRNGETGSYPYAWILGSQPAIRIHQANTLETRIHATGTGQQTIRFLPDQISSLSGSVGLIALPLIQYTLDGKQIAYTLTKNFTPAVVTPIYSWRVHQWGVCVSGTQVRTVQCTDQFGTVTVDSFCTTSKPSITQTCATPPPYTYTWHTYPWGACVGGNQSRNIICKNQNSEIVSDSSCLSPRPSMMQACGDIIITPVTPTKPLYIQGSKSTQGKDGIIGNNLNLGQVNLVDFSNALRKNFTEFFRGQNLNTATSISPFVYKGVRYIRGDAILSTHADALGDGQTLVVQDGNLMIDTDFNIAKKNIGIIVLRNNMTDNTKGHILIKPNVQFIGATIYAEGSIESVDASGNPFLESNTIRGNTLKNQLVFYGGVYTRNTVGGATLGSDVFYRLPGGQKSTDIHAAVRYDLGWLRMGNIGYNVPPLNTRNMSRDEATVILLNPVVSKTPPPLFLVK